MSGRVSGDLVTQVPDIGILSDQIDPFQRHARDLGGLGRRFEALAAQITERGDARPDPARSRFGTRSGDDVRVHQ